MNAKGMLLPALILLMGGIAACDDHSGRTVVIDSDSSIVNGGIRLHDGYVSLHPANAPPADIDASGTLRINDQPVTVDAAQRELLKTYFQNASAIEADGIATGKAGIAVAGQAIKSVTAGLASGKTDNIDKEVNAKADSVRLAALKICQDLHGVKSAQDQLGTGLSAFKPYSSIVGSDDVSDCEKDSKN